MCDIISSLTTVHNGPKNNIIYDNCGKCKPTETIAKVIWLLNMLCGEGKLMQSLDSALLISYRLSLVTVPLSVTVWPQFAMKILRWGSALNMGEEEVIWGW